MERKTVCRLCLKSCDTIFEDVKAFTLEMLRFIGLEMELNKIEKAVICKSCSENLQKCFDFKTVCLNVEDYIKSFKNDGNNIKLDLRGISGLKKQERMNKNGNISMSKCDAVCRLCMEIVESDSCVSLNGEIRNIMSAGSILREYFSELGLEITKNPVICTSCNESLRTYLSFVNNCLFGMKDRIKKYCEPEDCSNKLQVELNNGVPFEAECKSYYENSCNGIAIRESFNETELHDEIKLELEQLMQKEPEDSYVKHEVIDDDEADYIKTEELNDIVGKCDKDDQNNKIVLKRENCMETESPEFKIKHEGIHIEMEDRITAGFQDNVLILKDALAVDIHQCKMCKKHLPLHEDVSEIALHQCEECYYKTKSKCCLDTHKLIHTYDSKAVILQYDFYASQTSHEDALKGYMLIHKNTSEVTFPCSLCKYKAKRKDHLKRHMLTHKHFSELATYSCEVCTYKAKQKEHLNQHMLTHKDFSEVATYSCEVCTYKAKRKDNLKRHMLIHKDNSEITMYMCKLCTYKTKLKATLRQHMVTHKNPCELPTYSCKICMYKTNYKGNLKQHKCISKNSSDVTMFSCGICTYEAKEKGTLKQHMLIHKNASEVTMYSCDVCMFKTKRKGDLRRHMLTHKTVSEVTAYSCTICTYITKQKRDLKSHMLIHKNASEITMYSCGMCTYKAKRKSSVKRHMSIHRNASEITIYSCELCTFQTKHKNNLQEHKLIHKDASGVTMYSCEICMCKLKHKRSLKRHMLIHKNAPELTI